MKLIFCFRMCFSLFIPHYVFCTSIVIDNVVINGTGRGMNDSCIDGCSVNRMTGVVLPLYDSSHNISVKHSGSGILMEFPECIGEGTYTPRADQWTNINTFYRDGMACASFQHFSRKLCSRKKDELIIYADSGSLWRFDCSGSSCGCRQHLLIGLAFGPKDLPVKFFLRPTKAASRLYSSFGKETDVRLPAVSKWHDITITYEFNDTEVGTYVFNSYSLNWMYTVSNSTESLWIFAGNEDIVMPSLIALGCTKPPKHFPSDTVGMRPESFEGEKNKPTTWTPLLLLLAIPIIVIVTIYLKRRRGDPPASAV